MMQAVVLTRWFRAMQLQRFISQHRFMQLRVLLLLLCSWLLLSPVSAAVALLLSQWLEKTEAVIAASFFGPLLLLCWCVVALRPRAFRWFFAYLLISLLLALPWWLAPWFSF
jgi:hypothetical protein